MESITSNSRIALKTKRSVKVRLVSSRALDPNEMQAGTVPTRETRARNSTPCGTFAQLQLWHFMNVATFNR